MSRNFIPKEVIEREAQFLIEDYLAQNPDRECPPVPYENIIERHLELEFDVTDLRGSLGIPDVLGATYVIEQKIAIDSQLEDDPRYPFTCAHEIGHWILHREYIEAELSQGDLFDFVASTIICRDSHKEKPMEKQANIFAASLLMPRKMFRRVFEDLWPKYDLNADQAAWGWVEQSIYYRLISELATCLKHLRTQ